MLLLVTANSKAENYSITANSYAGKQPNIYMWLLASYLESQGIYVEVIDAETDGISNSALAKRIADKKPDLVGIVCMGSNPSSSTMSMIGVNDFFKYHNKDIPTFLWGGHPSALPEYSLEETGAS